MPSLSLASHGVQYSVFGLQSLLHRLNFVAEAAFLRGTPFNTILNVSMSAPVHLSKIDNNIPLNYDNCVTCIALFFTLLY